jgi:hypothetical protein
VPCCGSASRGWPASYRQCGPDQWRRRCSSSPTPVPAAARSRRMRRNGPEAPAGERLSGTTELPVWQSRAYGEDHAQREGVRVRPRFRAESTTRTLSAGVRRSRRPRERQPTWL